MKNLHLLGNVAATEEIVTTKAPLLFFIITPYLKIIRNFLKKIVRPFNQVQLNEEVEELRKLFFLSLGLVTTPLRFFGNRFRHNNFICKVITRHVNTQSLALPTILCQLFNSFVWKLR